MKSLAFKAFWIGDHFAPIKNQFNEPKNVFKSPKLGHDFAKNSINLQIWNTFLLGIKSFLPYLLITLHCDHHFGV